MLNGPAMQLHTLSSRSSSGRSRSSSGCCGVYGDEGEEGEDEQQEGLALTSRPDASPRVSRATASSSSFSTSPQAGRPATPLLPTQPPAVYDDVDDWPSLRLSSSAPPPRSLRPSPRLDDSGGPCQGSCFSSSTDGLPLYDTLSTEVRSSRKGDSLGATGAQQ